MTVKEAVTNTHTGKIYNLRASPIQSEFLFMEVMNIWKILERTNLGSGQVTKKKKKTRVLSQTKFGGDLLPGLFLFLSAVWFKTSQIVQEDYVLIISFSCSSSLSSVA